MELARLRAELARVKIKRNISRRATACFARESPNLKTSLTGSYHSFALRKYATRYLAAFAYRFNRRFDLSTLKQRLPVATVRCAPAAQRVFRVAEVHCQSGGCLGTVDRSLRRRSANRRLSKARGGVVTDKRILGAATILAGAAAEQGTSLSDVTQVKSTVGGPGLLSRIKPLYFDVVTIVLSGILLS